MAQVVGPAAMKALGAAGSTLGSVSSSMLSNGLKRVLPFTSGVFKATTTRGKVATTLLGAVLKYGWAAFVFAIAVVFWILKTILSRILPSVIKSFVDDWHENRLQYLAERRAQLLSISKGRTFGLAFRMVFYLVEFLYQLVAVTLYSFLYIWLKFVVDHFVAILFLLLGATAMTIFKLYLPGATSLYQETSIAGYESINAASDVGNVALSANAIVTPVNNFIVYSTVSMLIHIEAGASEVLGLNAAATPVDAGSDTEITRRFLLAEHEEDDRSAGEKFLETVVNILIVVFSFFLEFVLILIDVFFKILYKLLAPLMGVLIFLLRRIACVFAGQLCGFLEILDAIVNLVLTPIAWLIGKIPIACGANQLTRVSCDCAGYFWDFGHPGIYRNMQPCGTPDPRYSKADFSEYEGEGGGRRLLTVNCYKSEDGDYVEEIPGVQSLSRTSDLLQACPTAKRAFHSYSHAQDLHRFGTHDCITHCVLGVAIVSCDDAANHTVSVLGSCGDQETLDESEAVRRLSFLRVKDMREKLTAYKPKVVRNLQTQTADQSQEDRIRDLESRIPLRFSVPGIGECDLTQPPRSIFEFVDHFRCVVGRELYLNPDAWAPWKGASSSLTTRNLHETLDHAAHTLRKLKRAQEVDDVRDMYEPGDHVSVRHIVQWESKQRMKRRTHARRRRRLQLVLPADDTTFAPSASPTAYDDPNTEPVNPADPVPCLGKYLCPDQITCAVDEKYCAPPKEWSPVVWFSHHVQRFSSTVRSFDGYATMARAKKCYTERTRSPYDASYVFLSYEEKLRDNTRQWCLGEFAPSDFKFGTVQYSPKDDIQHLCSGTPNYQGCNCPDFWDTRGNEVTYSDVNSGILYTIGNGLKWFLYVIWLILNAVAEWIDHLLESAGLPNFSRASTSAYGLTDGEFAFCVFLHTGDAFITALFFILAYGFLKSTFYWIEWFTSVWLDTFERWLCIPDPNSDAEKLRALERHPFDRMVKEYELAYGTRVDTHAPIKIPVRGPNERRAAIRFKKWLVSERKLSPRNVVVPTKTEMRGAEGEKGEGAYVFIDFKRHHYA